MHMPGVENWEVDFLSHQYLDFEDGLQDLCFTGEMLDKDLLVSRFNHKLDRS